MSLVCLSRGWDVLFGIIERALPAESEAAPGRKLAARFMPSVRPSAHGPRSYWQKLKHRGALRGRLDDA